MRNNRIIHLDTVDCLKTAGRYALMGALFISLVLAPSLAPNQRVFAQTTSPGIDVSPTSGLSTSESGDTAQFSVSLTAPPGLDEEVTINLESSQVDEGTVSPETLTFTFGNWLFARTVTVTGVDDPFDDGDTAYTIQTQVVSSDPSSAYHELFAPDVSLNNLDNDSAGFTVNPTSGLTTSESGQSDSFSVALNSQPESSVSVFVNSSNQQEGTVDQTALFFSPNNWDAAQTVTVTGQDDGQIDGTQPYTILLSASSSDPAYQTSMPSVSVNNLDNDQPVVSAQGDSFTTSQDVSLSQPAPGVLANDDTNAGSLVAEIEASPANGTVSLNPDGSFTYTPAPGFTGGDTFVYRARNGGVLSEPTTVTINVIKPVTVTAQPDSYSVDQDQVLSVPGPGVLANDFTDGNNMSAELVTGVAHGTLSFNGNGSFVYVPTPGYSGSDSFTYLARSQSAQSSPVTVSLTINFILRVTARPDSYTANEGQALIQVAPGVLANDSTNGTTLTAELASNVAHGTLVLALDGSFTYTPAAGFSGVDSFSYYARSGMVISGPVTVTLTINLVNAPPVATADRYITNATSTTPFNVAAPGVLANDSDPELLPLTASVLINPPVGTLILNTNGSFSYTPPAGYNGLVSFTYQVTDAASKIASAKVDILVDTVAPPAPTWVRPGINGSTTEIAGGTMLLEVRVDPSLTDFSRVVFYRWDAANNRRLEIGSRQVAPYSISVDTATLNYKWNQIDAAVFDRAGNRSPLQHVWILRDLPPVAYLPFIGRR